MRRRRLSPVALLAAAGGVSAALVFFACCGCCVLPGIGGGSPRAERSSRSVRPAEIETVIVPGPGPYVETPNDPVANGDAPPEVAQAPTPPASELAPSEPSPADPPPAPELKRQASAETMSLDAVRLWTSADGAHTVEAVFQSYGQGVVTLERPDGETIDVPLEGLSERDQALIRKGR